MNSQICKICGNKDKFNIVYNGKIRNGKFGNYINNQIVLECLVCSVQFLDTKEKIDYENADYRNLVQEDFTEESYYKTHDAEQIYNLDVLQLDYIRGKSIADIGSGAGSFLDSVKGLASKTIAVEPFKYYQNILKEKGHTVFDYASNIDAELKVDLATSFAVIEHVDNPIQFLSEIKKIIKEDGVIILSTPNANDFQLDLIGDEYKSFFYRNVHQFYFNEKSLEYISKKLGFKRVEFVYIHKYDMSNLIFWLKDKQPTGLKRTKILEKLDLQLKQILKEEKIANFIYAKFYI